MSDSHALLWAILGAPLLGAVLAGVAALTGRMRAAAPAVTALGTLAAGIALLLTAGRIPPGGALETGADWLSLGGFVIRLGVRLDALGAAMVGVVCFVSFLVQVYSVGYMAGEAGYARYFAYLGIFTTSMLGLVTAGNLFQLYVCWELVGICSYLLIGFWWHKPSAASAAKKAFVVTRFGDVGFMLGVLLLASASGSFDFAAVGRTVTAMANGHLDSAPLVSPQTFLWLAPILLFCGAIGKSAQFPLHVWLPDAMEGPTPVSALIHAATMVAAGVYMVGRLFPIFAASAAAMDTVLLIGTITAFIAATIAIVQTDIKKVMAYSTVSQLGYMMLSLGAGGVAGRSAGLFHLTTHAMFKALLFLTAGAVIHALHHSSNPNDLRAMGGLRRRMPITAWTCLVGVLALAGLPPFAGFFSKDAILGAALAAGRRDPIAFGALAVGILVAGITSFYALRMWLMAFWGEPRTEEAAHAHEAPGWMTGPLLLLAVPSALLGFYLHRSGFFGGLFGEAGPETIDWGLASFTTLVSLAGFGLAWRLYARPGALVDPVTAMPAPVYRCLQNLWGIDAFWNRVGAAGSLALARTLAWFDRNVIDQTMNGIAWLVGAAGARLRRTTSGQAQAYAATMLAAIVLLLALVIVLESQTAALTRSAQAALTFAREVRR